MTRFTVHQMDSGQNSIKMVQTWISGAWRAL